MAATNGRRRRLTRWLPELSMAIALAILPFVFAAWLGSVDLFTRILIWGIFGLGFDLLFGRTACCRSARSVLRHRRICQRLPPDQRHVGQRVARHGYRRRRRDGVQRPCRISGAAPRSASILR